MSTSKRISKGKNGIRFAEDITKLEELKKYLCSEAVTAGKPKTDVCKACEAQCGYGRKLIRMYAGREKTKMPRARATSDEMTLQEQLDAKVQECMQVHEANRTMMNEVREMSAELGDVKDERDRLVAELNKMAKARQET